MYPGGRHPGPHHFGILITLSIQSILEVETMVQAKPNWSKIRGRIVEAVPHPELTDYVLARVDVQSVEAVPGFANMFESAAGQSLSVSIPRDKLQDIGSATDRPISAKIRLAHPGAVFVDAESVHLA
jgi:hypothetical protein